MSLRLVSLKEREEGRGYAIVEWFGEGDIAWGGGRWLPGRARSAIVDREGAGTARGRPKLRRN